MNKKIFLIFFSLLFLLSFTSATYINNTYSFLGGDVLVEYDGVLVDKTDVAFSLGDSYIETSHLYEITNIGSSIFSSDKFGDVYFFNGTSYIVSNSTSSYPELNYEAGTIAIWFNRSVSEDSGFLKLSAGDYAWGIGGYATPHIYTFAEGLASSTYVGGSFDNGWKHMALSWNASEGKYWVYYNGVMVKENIYTPHEWACNGSVNCSVIVGGGILNSIKGYIYEPIIYGKQLSNSDITTLYNYGVVGSSALSITDGNTSELVRFQTGESVNLSAISSDEYSFDNWTGDVIGVGKNVSISMTESKAVQVNFENINSPTITLIFPTNNSQLTTSPTNFQFKVTDDNYIENVTFNVNGQVEYIDNSHTNGTYIIGLSLDEGLNSWYIEAYDDEGAFAESDVWFFNYTALEVVVEEEVEDADVGMIMESSGAGLGKFVLYVAQSLPVLLISLAMIGLIVLIGWSVAELIIKFQFGIVKK